MPLSQTHLHPVERSRQRTEVDVLDHGQLSPATAVRTGRIAPSTKLWILITPMAAPYAAPTIAYWTSRQPVAPAIPPTTTPSRGAHITSVASVQIVAFRA
nr:hypothetical protein [Mycobacterium sp. DL99]